jgi:hypothetical protein
VPRHVLLKAMIDSAKGKPNQIAYWSRLTDWKIQTLTPNPDVIYLKPFFAGPRWVRSMCRQQRPLFSPQ